jgi:hypothetical protein
MLLNWVWPGALIWNDIRPHGYQLTITKPDGHTEVNTYDPYDSGSSRFILYTPDQVGTYHVKFVYPGEIYNYPNYTKAPVSSYYQNNIFGNDTFLGSSAEATFVVQQDPVSKLPLTPLPSEYWTRPIFGQNTEWQQISSNWLGGAHTNDRWQKEGTAPQSAHVMWTQPARFGGLVGGTRDPRAQFYLGFSYEDAFANPLIISGIFYYKTPHNHAGSGGDFKALDLRTGQQIWDNPVLNGLNSIQPSKGQLMDYQQADQHGTVGGYLWVVSGSTWVAYDAFSGNWVGNLTNVPSGTEVYTPTGDILRYAFSYSTVRGNGWMALWNNTHAITNAPASSASYGIGQQIRFNGQIIDAGQTSGDRNAYNWNVTIPTLPTDNVNPYIVGVIPGDIILGTSSNIALSAIPRASTGVPTLPWKMWAISDRPESRGQLLWQRTYPAPPNNYTIMLAWQPIDPVNRVWTMTYADTGERLGFDMVTGDPLWGPVGVPVNSINGSGLQYYSSREGAPAFGNLYVSGYGGQVVAYSMKNGSLLWTFNAINSGVESPWGRYPIHVGAFADGIVYAFSGEHSPNTPIYKGYRVYAINATTGEELWNLLDWSASGLGTSLANVAIADGYMVFLNGYDEQVYAIGKGPSQTTVSVEDNVLSQGETVLIQGKVIDISAGTEQQEQKARFPNGVPAVSDASQGGFMGYVYQQQTRPANTTGVTVKIEVIDANGNRRTIGTPTTSVDTGMFYLPWTVDVPGAYTVIASFEGSKSYFVSKAETSFYATAAHAATPAPTAPPASAADMYFVPAVVGIIIAIIVVGLGVIFALRKRP